MAGTPGLGHKSYLLFAKESAYATFTTPTKKLEMVSWNIAPVVGVINDLSLYSQPSKRAMYQGGLLYKGTFVVRLNYEGLEELFRAVFGLNYTSTVIEASTRDHKFIETATLPSLSMEVILGDIPTTKCFRVVGAKLVNITIRGTAGTGNDAMLTAEFTVLAKDVLSNQTITGSGSFPSVFPVLFHHAVVVDDGTADSLYDAVAGNQVRLRNFEVTLEQPHDEGRFYLGSVNIDEPLRQDFLVARYRFTQEFITKTLFDAARQFTSGGPRLVFQHPTSLQTHTSTVVTVNAGTTITRASGSFVTDGWVVGDYVTPSAFVPVGCYVTAVAALTLTVDSTCLSSGGTTTVTGSTNREFEVRSNQAQLVEYSDPVEDYGIIRATSTWEAFFDATDVSAMFVRIRNALAALP